MTALQWSAYEAVLFDLDGVVTPTAQVHERAWAELFSAEFDYAENDYLELIDGKARITGVKSFLNSRGIDLPEGSQDDPSQANTLWGYGNRKNAIVMRMLDEDGIIAYPGTVALLDHLDRIGVRYAIVSSSRNAPKVLQVSGLAKRFPIVVDGNVIADRGLGSKPAPDGFLLGAELLHVDPAATVVIEDAVSGVKAGVAGHFGTVVAVDRGAGHEALEQAGAHHIVGDLAEMIPTQVEGMRPKPAPTGMDQTRFPAEPWRLVETAPSTDDLGLTETLFGTGNGFLGMRATPEEGTPTSLPGTFLNGFYETWPIKHAEDAFAFARTGQTIVNVPDTKTFRIEIDGELVDSAVRPFQDYERAIDFRSGLLTRSVVWQTSTGKQVRIETSRMTSFEHRNLAVMQCQVTALSQPVDLGISTQTINFVPVAQQRSQDNSSGGIAGDPRKATMVEGGQLRPTLQQQHDNNSVLGFRTKQSDLGVACGSRFHVETTHDVAIDTTLNPDLADTTLATSLIADEPFLLTKLVVFHTDKAASDQNLIDQCLGTLNQASELGVQKLQDQQRAWLDGFWSRSDIETTGATTVQQALRWNLFQLAQASACIQAQSIPAKGVSSGGYDGHYFWDTEVYVVPFLSYTSPEVAKEVLQYRHNVLDNARTRAREMNQEGALYAWRTINGDECSAYYPAGTAQYHINAAVAFALERYTNASGDTEFLASKGLEILVETARLWADLGFFASDGRFHLHGVTGPDEYTAVVNDNAYTNLMAQANLQFAVDAVGNGDVPAGLAVTTAEIARWQHAANAMYVPYDEALQIHKQDADFLQLKPWPWATTPADKHPLLLNFHPLVIYRHQVLKQADLVLATVLRPNAFTAQERRRNFDYYDPITTGDSSLSAGSQATAAARVGYSEQAWDYFNHALYLDLCNTHNNSTDGVHIASTGGVWNAIVSGFLGFTDDGESISFDPQVPAELGTVTTHLVVRGQAVTVQATGTSYTVS